MIYVDKNGQHVSPLYTWQDGRGNRKLSGGKTASEILQEEYGRKIHTGYGLATHVYHMYSSLVPAAAASFCTIADYFGMYLTGRKIPLIHSSMAASMGVYNAASQEVDTPLLKALSLPESLYPEVTSDFVSIGSYRSIPVCVALGDNQASFLGSVDTLQNTVLLNMGTGGQVSVLSDAPFQAENIEARPVCRDVFLLAGSSLCGGRAYALLKDFFRSYAEAMGITNADHYSIMNSLLEKGVPEDRLKVSTLFAGTRENPQLRGVVENISTENFTPAALIDGVLDGMTEELYQYFLLMKQGTGKHFEILKASGNGVRKNRWLQQKVSERFALPLSLTAYGEEAARGAAKTALIASGAMPLTALFGTV
jgi:sedoheptulokinase